MPQDANHDRGRVALVTVGSRFYRDVKPGQVFINPSLKTNFHGNVGIERVDLDDVVHDVGEEPFGMKGVFFAPKLSMPLPVKMYLKLFVHI